MKIFKWIFALVAGIGGILAMMLVPAGNKRKKIKALDKKIKAVDEEIKNTNKKQKNLKAFLSFSKHIPKLEETHIPIVPKYKKKLKASKFIKSNKDNNSLF